MLVKPTLTAYSTRWIYALVPTQCPLSSDRAQAANLPVEFTCEMHMSGNIQSTPNDAGASRAVSAIH